MRVVLICCLLVIFWLSPTFGGTQVNTLPAGCELIGRTIIKANSFNKDRDAMRSIDAMVPLLKKIDKGKVVRIEGSFGRSVSKAERIQKSLELSKEVERYLRQKHNISLDLYMAAQDDIVDKNPQKSIRILVYQTEFSEMKVQ